MQSFEEAIHELEESIRGVLMHLGEGQIDQVPEDLPAIAKKVWGHGTELFQVIQSKEFRELIN
jgi:hypothetical protein